MQAAQHAIQIAREQARAPVALQPARSGHPRVSGR
jgi:hypothetical protein